MTRILHIVGKMDRAGTETWLMNVLRNTNRREIVMDFLVHEVLPGDYDQEINDLGGKIIRIPTSTNLITYLYSLYKILVGVDHYDVIHSHVHHFSGLTLFVARLARVKIRIAHSHNDTSVKDNSSSFVRRFYLRAMEKLIAQSATKGLAASELAAISLFGNRWREDGRWKILYCGIDFGQFSKSTGPRRALSYIGIPENRFVVGHVGRFVPQKNHEFLIEIFNEIKNINPNSHLLLVGVGPLLKKIQCLVLEKRLNDHVTFAGSRSDVPQLMTDAMDIFVFPSTHEGLGLVLVEAQAAGLPCVISDVIPDEVAVSNIVKISLESSPSIWATRIFALMQRSSQMPEEKKEKDILLNQRFSIESSIKNLRLIYENIDANNKK